MKKILSLILCLVMLTSIFISCTEKDEDKGAAIPAYLTTEIKNFDPALAYTDEASIKVLGLIYEGLTTIDGKGKVKGAMAKSWKYKSVPEDDYYVLEFQIIETAWSDGRILSADDFVYAWKRILEPEFHSEAASMLFSIKNAVDVKRGDLSIDDLGIYAVDTYVLQVQFETDIDYNLFLEYCASPMLVPLREDAVNKVSDWATNPSVIVTNGPFTIRTFTNGSQLTIERNIYYKRNVDDDSIKKYVTPYRLVVDYTKDAAAQLKEFEDGSILYMSELPLAQRAAYADQVTIEESMNTHTYFFNTTKAPFDDPNVRLALSKAVDRNAIASLVTYAVPATGIVNGSGVFDADKKTNFRSVGGDLISPSADLAAAKSLVSGGGSFEITIRPNEVDRAVAEYCAGVWGELGFNVTIRELGSEAYKSETEYDLLNDLFTDAYEAGDFDVIAIDWQAISTDAWSALAPFAKQYAGGAKDLVSGNFDDVPHITGFDDENYNNFMEEVFAIKDRGERTAKLHEAETMLVQSMPVMPLFTYQHAYLVSSELSNVR
ncbi:MAG: peptide ABC transporter substrate-binding protein, partial [Eubacteriales bacterium]|nr:peptide ABC transporter substrate-binding protein [Eubacteriales bacterium]